MGRKSRSKKERRERKIEHGWVVDLATPGGWPAGRFWFRAPDQSRAVRPQSVKRFIHHTQAEGLFKVVAVRPATQIEEE